MTTCMDPAVAGVSTAANLPFLASVRGEFAANNVLDVSAIAVDSAVSDVIAAITRVLTLSLL